MDNSQQLLGFVCDVRFIHWNCYSDTALTVVADARPYMLTYGLVISFGDLLLVALFRTIDGTHWLPNKEMTKLRPTGSRTFSV